MLLATSNAGEKKKEQKESTEQKKLFKIPKLNPKPLACWALVGHTVYYIAALISDKVQMD